MSITINGIKLDDDPLSLPVYEEVIQRDCYRVGSIPENAEWIIDIGAFHGEFMLWAHHHRPIAGMVGYEPNAASYSKAWRNLQVVDGSLWDLWRIAVGELGGWCRTLEPKGHPAGTVVESSALGDLPMVGIESVVAGMRRIALKMDCEGSERAIFSSLDWLKHVDWLAMEFHNHDGHQFAKKLVNAGFAILALEGCQGDSWDKSMAGGILIARRP